jgi:hypothetical protein
VSGILSRLIRSYGLETKLLEYNLRRQWKGIVGAGIAEHTIPARIQQRRLYLWVDSTNWLGQLTLLKPILIQKINSHLNQQFFKGIILQQGQPPGPFVLCPEEDRASDRPFLSAAAEPSHDLELCIQEYLKPVWDPSLKEVLRRVMIKTLTQAQPDARFGPTSD